MTDLARIDQNLATIRAIEGAWALPGLPDEVKLDLVSQQSVDPDQLASFLYGIDGDVQQAQRQRPLPVPDPIGDPLSSAPVGGQRVASTAYGIMSQRAPRTPDIQAVQKWKRRATSQGYLNLPDAEVHNDRWLPEYNAVAREMNLDQMGREFSGDRPGSMSATSFLQTLGEWVSPANLYKQVVNFDLMWDFEAIKSEAESWGDKWDKFAANPTSPRALLDFVTGPIDDVAMPIINWGLMFIGVGEVVAIGRGLGLLSKIPKFAPNALRGLIPTRTLRNALSAADNIDEAARMIGPGQGVPGQIFSHTAREGPKMAAFRNNPIATHLANLPWARTNSFVMARKVNQQVMRLGFTGKLEEWAGLGGAPLPGADAVSAWYDRTITDNVPASLLLDVVSVHFLPLTIFQPGTIGSIAGAAGRGAAKIWYADFLPTGTRRLFQRIGTDEQASLGLGNAHRRMLEESEGAEAVATWDREVKAVGHQQAVANKYANGSLIELGQLHYWAAQIAGTEGLAAEVTSMDGRLAKIDDMTYLQQRSAIGAKIHHYSPNDPDLALNHIALYDVLVREEGWAERGLSEAVTLRSPAAREQAIADVKEAYRETAEVVAARGGAVQEGAVRLYRTGGAENMDGRVWSTVADRDNPIYMDLNLEEAAEAFGMSTDQVLAMLDNGVPAELSNTMDVFSKRYQHASGVPTRVADALEFRPYDPAALKRLRVPIQSHNDARKATLRDLFDRTIHANPAMLEEFYYKILPTMGGMGNFIRSSNIIDNAHASGRLANVTYRTPLSPAGRKLSVIPWAKGGMHEGPWGSEITDIFDDLAGSDDVATNMNHTMFSPFAREFDPTTEGFTIGRYDPTKLLEDGVTLDPGYSTVFKDEALEYAGQALYRINIWNAIKKLGPKAGQLGSDSRLAEATRRYGELAGQFPPGHAHSDTTIRKFVTQVAEDMAMADESRQSFQRVVLYAQRNGVDLIDVEQAVLQDMSRINMDLGWAQRYGVSDFNRPSDVATALGAKIKDLQKKSFYMASRLEGVPDDIVEALGADNKVLVHGVDFIQPKDILNDTPELAEITAAQMRQMAIGNFFLRKSPQEVGILRTRLFRSSLWASLERSKRVGGDIRLNAGAFKDGSEDLKRIEDDLMDILQGEKDATASRRNLGGAEGKIARVAHNVTAGTTPHTVSDLASLFYGKGRLARQLRLLSYTEDEITAIWEAVHTSRALGFKTEGLYAVETYLRSKPQGIQALRLFGRHVAADNFTKAQKIGISAIGTGAISRGAVAYGGYQLGANEYNDITDQEGNNFGAFVAGAATALTGRMAAHALVSKIGWAAEAPARLGRVSKHFEGLRAGAMASKWEQGNWTQYAYLADNLAGLRDYARFAISPLFDASRYSEAIILSQMADLPPGMARLGVRQSPSAYRAHVRRGFQRQGMDKLQARGAADKLWEVNRAQFLAASRGDFNYEAVESLAGFTDQAGILGFSPSEWMVSTFSHLMDAKIEGGARKAYEISRDIYTYGTKGRSSAELSMNFVFFPFSFTKKSLGHVWDFMKVDVGRSILMHDMMKTYELLNENYNLTEFFEERMPILNKMNRLNLFAYGINLGEFGGINAPFLQALGETPPGQILSQRWNPVDVILNQFVPQVVEIKDQEQADELAELIKRTLPVWSDIHNLISDLGQQSKVAFSDSHMTSRAETDRAYTEWRAYQNMWADGLEANGMTWNDAVRNEQFSAMVQAKKTEIGLRYPAWKVAMWDGIAHNGALEMELKERLANPAPRSGDIELASFNRTFETVTAAVGTQGFNWDEPEFMPPVVFTALRKEALRLHALNPRFIGIYNRFYRRLLGDISTELIDAPRVGK